MPSVQHSELFNCTPQELFKIISDYERYPEFLNEVKECRVIKSDEGKKLVEYKVSLVKNFSYTLQMMEHEPDTISWEFVKGEIFKSQTGSWKLAPEAGKTRVTYSVDASFSVFVPGMLTKTLLSAHLPMMMSAYHKRVKDLYGK